MSERTPVGKTKGQGWEIGVRRMFPISMREAWEVLTSKHGLETWLGAGVTLPFKKGETYLTTDETAGDIRSYTEGSLIRMTWHPRGWESASTLQIRVLPAKTGATISVHHERLQNGEQREAMRQHWTDVLDKLERQMKS